MRLQSQRDETRVRQGDGWENCDRIAEIKVTKKTASHDPKTIVSSTMNTDRALSKSLQIMVRLGRQRLAKVPPIIENRKIGANSATDISETAKGLLPVRSITNNRIAKLRTQIPVCNKIPDMAIAWTKRLLKKLFVVCDNQTKLIILLLLLVLRGRIGPLEHL